MRIAHWVVLVALAGTLAGRAAADEVTLRNGDRLRGEITSMSGGKLVLRTPYAGDVALRWGEVASLATSRPIDVMLKGEKAPLRGTLQPLYDGRALLVGADGAVREFALGDIAFLNPRPWESGVGVAYSGRVTLSAAFTRGNSEDERLHGDAEFNARAALYRYTLSGRIDRIQEAAGTEETTTWLANGNYDRFISERRFLYARGSLEHDRTKGIERRTTLGAGYGAELVDTPRARLSLRGGLDWVAVDRIDAPDERYPAFGWGVKATYGPWFHENDGFWNLEDTDVVTIRSKTGVRLPLLERLAATAQITLDWESRPVPGRKSTDSGLFFGVDYAF